MKNLSERIQKLLEEVVAMTDNYPITMVGYVPKKEDKKKVDKENKDPDKE